MSTHLAAHIVNAEVRLCRRDKARMLLTANSDNSRRDKQSPLGYLTFDLARRREETTLLARESNIARS